MEIISNTPIYGSINRYWRRRHYERLDVKGKRIEVIRLGGKRKTSWKIKAIRKLKFGFRIRIASPFKLLGKLRDAYMTMMLSLSQNVGSLSGQSLFVRKTIKEDNDSQKFSKAEEFENKLIFEIYKALKDSRGLGSR
ncbi:hypothetical protein ACHQM5_009415 [Ranunculus cassubicifolius]